MPALEKSAVGLGERPALLVVDASIAFTDPACALGADFSAEIAVIAELMSLAEVSGWPRFFSTVWYESDEEARVFRAKVPALNLLGAGSPLVAIDPRLPVDAADTVFRKTHASCFFGTELHRWLQRRGVDSLVIAGFTTSGCVRASAVDALQNDYRTTVVSDAVGDRDAAAHAANLYDIEAKYGDVVTLASLLS
ncbi:MAG: isochorismatase family protein [Pseudomonadales bacterium]|nr:isochorismatase family protein [Pseudomonadales bacterium]NIX08080.1 isochorismatase family protein [Pseudomonadales bacterium]